MEVELFVHGVPSGEGFWGKKEDRNYFGTFYDNSTDDVKFLVQTRKLNGKSYCYYNYLIYKTYGAQSPNVVAYDGREGSYFGITLRLDAYCKDISNMYRILDTVFNVYVMGTLLKMEKTKLKYTTPDFTSVSSVLENIEKDTLQLIQNAFSIDSFTRLDGFAINGVICPSYNLYDCTPENVMLAVKQYSRVAVSPFFANSKEIAIQKQYKDEIQILQQNYNSRLQQETDAFTMEKNQLELSLTSANSQISQLQNDLEYKNTRIVQLERDVSRLKSENRNMGQNRKISQIIAPIRVPIIELADILKRIGPASPTIDKVAQKPKKVSKLSSILSVTKSSLSFVPFFNFVLLLIIAMILFNSPNGKVIDNTNRQNKIKQEKIEQRIQKSSDAAIKNAKK